MGWWSREAQSKLSFSDDQIRLPILQKPSHSALDSRSQGTSILGQRITLPREKAACTKEGASLVSREFSGMQNLAFVFVCVHETTEEEVHWPVVIDA